MNVPINYLAVLVGAISSMVIGFLWYGPLFGKAWVRLMGWTPEKMAEMKEKSKSMSKLYVLQLIGSLVMSFVMAHSIYVSAAYFTAASELSIGLQAGFWNWLGFIAPVSLGMVLWEGKSWKLWGLSNAYYLISLLVMGVILATWM